jgi:hypothetical protein
MQSHRALSANYGSRLSGLSYPNLLNPIRKSVDSDFGMALALYGHAGAVGRSTMGGAWFMPFQVMYSMWIAPDVVSVQGNNHTMRLVLVVTRRSKTWGDVICSREVAR